MDELHPSLWYLSKKLATDFPTGQSLHLSTFSLDFNKVLVPGETERCSFPWDLRSLSMAWTKVDLFANVWAKAGLVR